MKITVLEAMANRFEAGTTTRSAAYRIGFQQMLEFKIENKSFALTPYRSGTAEHDAYFAGLEHAADYLNMKGS